MITITQICARMQKFTRKLVKLHAFAIIHRVCFFLFQLWLSSFVSPFLFVNLEKL